MIEFTDARLAYYRKAAKVAGVPSMWLDDAVQDIAVRVWRAQLDVPLVVNRAAIDAARMYGLMKRSKRLPLHVVSLVLDDEQEEYTVVDPYGSAEEVYIRRCISRALWYAVRRGVALLTPAQRACLLRNDAQLARTRMAKYTLRSLARKRMREYLREYLVTGEMPPTRSMRAVNG